MVQGGIFFITASKTMKEKKYYAHSADGRPPEQWQRLEDHLREVAEVARGFANDFQAGDWGYLVGPWHDIGKYTIEFQEMLTTKLMKSRILYEIHCTT